MPGLQGRNQVCSQMWVRLENFPFPDFSPVEIFILVHPKQISLVSKSNKQKRKKSRLYPRLLLQFPFLLFLSSPFPLFSLALFYLSISSFSLSFPFFLLTTLPFKISPNLSKDGRLFHLAHPWLRHCRTWKATHAAINRRIFGEAQKHVYTTGQLSLFNFLEHLPLAQASTIDIEYNKRLDRQRPCLEGDFNGGSNNIVQSNKSVWRRW